MSHCQIHIMRKNLNKSHLRKKIFGVSYSKIMTKFETFH